MEVCEKGIIEIKMCLQGAYVEDVMLYLKTRIYECHYSYDLPVEL